MTAWRYYQEIIGHDSNEDGAKWQRPAVQNIGDALNTAFQEEIVSKEIIGKVTASCNADSDVGKITLELVKVLVPAVTESVKTTVQKTVTESLLQFSKMEEKNIKKFEGKVNTVALFAKYERDNLEQQGRKECLRFYRVPNDEDEKYKRIKKRKIIRGDNTVEKGILP